MNKKTKASKSIKDCPTIVIQTVRGPVAVKQGQTDSNYLRGYAPAFIMLADNGTRVTFLPVGFAEEFIDFRFSSMIGTNAIPENLKLHYEEYVDNFIKGDYRIVKVDAKIEAEEVSVEVAQG
jgi:hypothetical protein